MNARSASLSLAVLVLTAACGAPRDLHAVVADAPHPVVTVPPGVDPPPPAEGPSQFLDCVSAPVPGEDGTPQVIRASISWSSSAAQLNLTAGPQFFSHGGVSDTATNVSRTLDAAVSTGNDVVHFLATTSDVRVDVRQDGVAWQGQIVDGETRALTCFSFSDLFGGEYGGGGASLLPATFDWQRDACVDADGKPALNQIPIEVVRETGFASCADLSGQALNGDDLNMPDLVGWDLAGAKLDGASLFFANLTSASLQGADLRGLQFGYANLGGSVDDATALPRAGACTVSTDQWQGTNLSCAN